MPLYLFEVAPAPADRSAIAELLDEIDQLASDADAEVIEFQVAEAGTRLFVIAETGDVTPLAGGITRALAHRAEVTGPDPVRLVGAELADVKAARPAAGYLVEWDLPADLGMDDYLARKRANAPKYADVPEVSFLRTYVREDMAKCVCLYDAPEEHLVRKAREAVGSPVDRLHRLRGSGSAG